MEPVQLADSVINLTHLEEYRIDHPKLGASTGQSEFGAFAMPDGMAVIASSGSSRRGYEWDHISCSYPDRIPTWDEMCNIKKIFFHKHEAVIQIHPPEEEYVNYHPYCLHLWRYCGGEFPMPPSWMVGPK